jgi:signal recognition particle GTPase
MYDSEKNDIKRIDMKKKKEIAETTQLDVSDIQDLLTKFTQMQGFHEWIKNKQKNGEPLPESREEL